MDHILTKLLKNETFAPKKEKRKTRKQQEI